MKKMMKTYYRKLVANKRRKSRLARLARTTATYFADFHGLDDDFCAWTILPRIACRDEHIPLDNKLVIALPREYLNDFGPYHKNNMLLNFAGKMEQSLSELLSRSVSDFNRGHTAGYCSRMYDLGTKDEPVRIDYTNALDNGVTLASCGMEVPAASYDSQTLIVPPFMAYMIGAKELKFSDPFPILPKHIRSGVEELGKLMDNALFTDEAITGQSAAYAIRAGAIRWNFKFMYNADDAHGSLLVMLRYGFFIPYPEYIVKMEVSNG